MFKTILFANVGLSKIISISSLSASNSGCYDRNLSLICQPKLDNLLYGSENLTNDENEKIFLAVQEFIIKSKRF